jgi:hypothetical protein
MLNKLINYFKQIYITRLLIKREVSNLQNQPSKVIYINTIRSLPNHFITEVNLALIFLKSGFKVEIILDDGVFEHVEYTVYSGKPRLFYVLIFILGKIRRRLDFFLWNKFIGHISKNFIIKGVSTIHYDKMNYDYSQKSSDFVKSSMIRFFNNEIWENSHISFWYENITQYNVQISKGIGSYVQDKLKDCDIFVTSHGIYSLWGPAFNQIRNSKQKIVYGPNIYCVSKLQLFNNTQQFSFIEDSLTNFLLLDLGFEEQKKVEEFLNTRFELKGKDTRAYFNDVLNNDDFKLPKREQLPGKVFVAFPNVIWDGNIAERDTLFKSIRDWIILLIEHFKKFNKNTLIIRFHPAETTWLDGSVKFESTLVEYLNDINLYENIKIISSGNRLKSYDLLNKYADYTLVYDGFIALESPFWEVPVLFAASGRFNVSNFGLQFKSINEYFDFISNPKEILNLEDQRILAIKIIYYYIFYNSYYFPVLANENDDYSYDAYAFLNSEKKLENSAVSIMLGVERCL